MKAIVYTSNTGHSAEYARILGANTGLPVYSLNDGIKQLEQETEIIYIGWLMANTVKGYKKAAKYFQIKAVCGVGLCENGCLLDEVRKAIALSAEIPLFTVQGGMDKTKLRGINRFMINMLIKMMSSKEQQSEEDERKLELLKRDANYVKEENLSALLEWYRNQENLANQSRRRTKW